MPTIPKTKVLHWGVLALIVMSAFFIITVTNSQRMQTQITGTSYAGLCDESLIAEPEKHTWEEYISSAYTSAEAQKNESALFCFLIGKIYVTHKISSEAGVDERNVLNSIIADQSGFYGLFEENPERGIEIANAALEWNKDFGNMLTSNDSALLSKINDQVLIDISTLKNEYKMVLARKAGITYTLKDLKNEGVTLPDASSEFIKTSDDSLEGNEKNVYYKTDFNFDGVDDIVFLTANSSKQSITAVLNTKNDTVWVPYTLSLIKPTFGNSFSVASFYIEGNRLTIIYTLDVSGPYKEYNIGNQFSVNWNETEMTYTAGKPASAQIFLYTEIVNEIPVITTIQADLGKYNEKNGVVHYDQSFDLKNSLYERNWSGFGGNADESDIEKIVSKPLNFKPIPWSEFTQEALAEILEVAE